MKHYDKKNSTVWGGQGKMSAAFSAKRKGKSLSKREIGDSQSRQKLRGGGSPGQEKGKVQKLRKVAFVPRCFDKSRNGGLATRGERNVGWLQMRAGCSGSCGKKGENLSSQGGLGAWPIFSHLEEQGGRYRNRVRLKA